MRTMRLAWLTLLAMGVTAGAIWRCGFHDAGCTAGNCSGCCDKGGTCQTGTEDVTCGSGGASCTDCTQHTLSCVAHACGVAPPDGGGSDAGDGNDSGNPGMDSGQPPMDSGQPPMDAGSGKDAGTDAGSFVALSPCNLASDYDGGTIINFGGGLGRNYSPNCLKVTVGTRVQWVGSFVGHPLAQSGRGTRPNPIPSVSTGTDAGVTFNTVGYYPYYCALHGNDAGTVTGLGSNMAGVVQVVP